MNKMFNSKQETLFMAKESPFMAKETSANQFIRFGLKESAKTSDLGNGALKLSTTGNDFVDQFAKATNYKLPRSYEEIDNDMRLLWSQDKSLTVSLTFYLRMITRIVVLPNGEKTQTTQRGQGLKNEGIYRMIWIAINHPDTFWNNIVLYISIASWKDIIMMLSYDLQYNGWNNRLLDWNKFGKLILAGLENPNSSELIKKYLPQIKTTSKCTTLESQADTIIAKWMCSLLFGGKGNEHNYKNYKLYRKLKTSGTAHEWQKLISQGRFLDINFNTVHGRALAQLVSGKFLANNHLEEKYEAWIETKPAAKYTGYVYELLSPIKKGYENNNKLKKYQETTINKQFYQLIETAKNGMNEGQSGLIVVVDSSSSMTSLVPGTKVSAYDVAKSMALYFSYLLNGIFEKTFMQFDDKCELIKWKGNTPVENIQNDRCEAYGSTNFLSIAKTFGNILKKGVSEKDFPTGILCISDGCFNSIDDNINNFTALKNKLLNYGFSNEFVKNFKVVLWDIPNNFYGATQTAFEDFADTPNLYHISGLDGSAIAFLTGIKGQKSEPKNSQELFESAMDQEVLNLIEI